MSIASLCAHSAGRSDSAAVLTVDDVNNGSIANLLGSVDTLAQPSADYYNARPSFSFHRPLSSNLMRFLR